MGGVERVFAEWHLGVRHKIESDDVCNALLRYASGATGVIQTATAVWPGLTERIELHGTKGTAILTADKISKWEVIDDALAESDPAPIADNIASGSSDPMAIGLAPFERLFTDFAEAIRAGREPVSSGEGGLRALELVQSIYASARETRVVALGQKHG